jgi:hypothetical protein
MLVLQLRSGPLLAVGERQQRWPERDFCSFAKGGVSSNDSATLMLVPEARAPADLAGDFRVLP